MTKLKQLQREQQDYKQAIQYNIETIELMKKQRDMARDQLAAAEKALEATRTGNSQHIIDALLDLAQLKCDELRRQINTPSLAIVSLRIRSREPATEYTVPLENSYQKVCDGVHVKRGN